MNRLYQKSELNFSLMWIAAYVGSAMAADALSALMGIRKVITAPVLLLFALLLLGTIRRNNLSEKYGLCAFRGNRKDYLYFIPLAVLASANVWNGVKMNGTAAEMALYVLSMLCVGLIEEVLFRGFLFKAMCTDGVKRATLISSVTFGMGHIVNLLSGRELLSTLLQIGYATVIGFLFTVIFLRGKSLWPCIVTHGALNALSALSVPAAPALRAVSAIGMGVLCLGYALWVLRKTRAYAGAEKAGEAG